MTGSGDIIADSGTFDTLSAGDNNLTVDSQGILSVNNSVYAYDLDVGSGSLTVNNLGDLSANSGTFDTLTVGSGSDTGILQSNGDYNLQLKTGNTDTGSITIEDGENGYINILANGTGEIDLTTSGLIDINGATFDVNATDTCTIDNANTTNGVTINTAITGGPVSIGHTTSETTVNDNLTVTGKTIVNEGLIRKGSVIPGGGHKSYSVDEVLSGLIIRNPTGTDRTDTLPTASSIISAIPNASDGDYFELFIENTNSSKKITISTNTGLTLRTSSNDVNSEKCKKLLFIITSTSSNTITVYDGGELGA